jgi:hypothetical protein
VDKEGRIGEIIYSGAFSAVGLIVFLLIPEDASSGLFFVRIVGLVSLLIGSAKMIYSLAEYSLIGRTERSRLLLQILYALTVPAVGFSQLANDAMSFSWTASFLSVFSNQGIFLVLAGIGWFCYFAGGYDRRQIDVPYNLFLFFAAVLFVPLYVGYGGVSLGEDDYMNDPELDLYKTQIGARAVQYVVYVAVAYSALLVGRLRAGK